MKSIPKSVGRNVLLIIILFAIVAVASGFIIAHLGESFHRPEDESVVGGLILAILALTLGCLFLAGALGLWAIRSTAEIEGRRRIGRFVDTMDYLSDGLLVLDRSGRITGSNPAARQMAPRIVPANVAVTLRDMFSCLADEDMDCLLDFKQPREIERDCVYTHGLRALRFRSQPSEDVMLVLISDVTDMRSREIRQRQIAQLQLVGRIAAGMAHDFNNILCSISGHAALLARRQDDTEAAQRSINIILEATEKGSLLSRKLLGLSRSSSSDAASENLPQDIEDAAAVLRVALSPAWTVNTIIEGEHHATPLTAVQIEQVILNLGLLVADAQAQPGLIMITLQKPGAEHLLNVGEGFAAVMTVSGGEGISVSEINPDSVANKILGQEDGFGVVLSVLNSMVEQARGRIDRFVAASGFCLYRVCLPHLDVRSAARDDDGRADSALDHYVASWKVLLGGASSEMEKWKRHLERLGAVVIEKETIVSLLAYFESSQALDGIVVDKHVLGLEADGLLKAMLKLCPRAGIVVLCNDPGQEPAESNSAIVFAPYGLDPERMIRSLVEAKGRACSADLTAATA